MTVTEQEDPGSSASREHQRTDSFESPQHFRFGTKGRERRKIGARFAAGGGVRPLRNLNAPTRVAPAVRQRTRARRPDARPRRQRGRQGADPLDRRGAGYRKDAACGRARDGGDATRNGGVGTLRRRRRRAGVLALGRKYPGSAADGPAGETPTPGLVPRPSQRPGSGPRQPPSHDRSPEDGVRPLSAVRCRSHAVTARLLARPACSHSRRSASG